MSHTTNTLNATPLEVPMVHSQIVDWESLLDRIISNVTKIAKSFSDWNQVVSQHNTFIESNLLDPVMGPEISRTLRR